MPNALGTQATLPGCPRAGTRALHCCSVIYTTFHLIPLTVIIVCVNQSHCLCKSHILAPAIHEECFSTVQGVGTHPNIKYFDEDCLNGCFRRVLVLYIFYLFNLSKLRGRHQHLHSLPWSAAKLSPNMMLTSRMKHAELSSIHHPKSKWHTDYSASYQSEFQVLDSPSSSKTVGDPLAANREVACVSCGHRSTMPSTTEMPPPCKSVHLAY